jgi:hypothetical protein
MGTRSTTTEGDAMSTPGHVPDGTDLLAQELRDEVSHLVRHPVAELKRL